MRKDSFSFLSIALWDVHFLLRFSIAISFHLQVGKDRRGLEAGMGAAEDRQEWRRIFDTDLKYVFV